MVHSQTLLHGLIRVLWAPAAVAMLLAWLAAVPAQAKITTKTYTVPLVFQHGASPFDSDNCSAFAFAAFPRVRGAVSATMTRKTADGRTFTNSKPGPLFEDVLDRVRIYSAPSDRHWLEVTSVSNDGGAGPNDCSGEETRIRGLLPRTVTVKVTIDRSVSCGNAKDARKLAAKDYADYKKVLAKTTQPVYVNIYTRAVKTRKLLLARADQEVKRECVRA